MLRVKLAGNSRGDIPASEPPYSRRWSQIHAAFASLQIRPAAPIPVALSAVGGGFTFQARRYQEKPATRRSRDIAIRSSGRCGKSGRATLFRLKTLQGEHLHRLVSMIAAAPPRFIVLPKGKLTLRAKAQLRVQSHLIPLIANTCRLALKVPLFRSYR